jgi:diguanylate cyclase (GGDEF)-like protein
MYLDKQTLLMVEDPLDALADMRLILEQDYKLLFAATGREGQEIARSRQPDLILLSPKLPDHDAYEVCSRLRADPQTHKIPIILMVNSEAEINLESLDAGAVDYVVRPCQPALLKARLRVVLELKRCRDLLEGQETLDGVTGIPNQRQFEQLLNHEWRRALRYQTPQSLILLDIDFFKAYTDGYGQFAGDECLRQIAHILVKIAKRETDCVARIGNDEFVYLLPETDASGAIQVAHQIQEAVENLNLPHAGSPVADHVTLSIGVATLRPTLKLKPDQLIHLTIAHLNNAKKSGCNQIKYSQV